MNLEIRGDRLKINLTFLEKLLTLQFNHTFEISLAHIERVTTEKPSASGLHYRMPGTAIPGLLTAGTYYGDRGREFWYVMGDRHCITLDLKDEFYQRIVLTLDQNELWSERLSKSLA